MRKKERKKQMFFLEGKPEEIKKEDLKKYSQDREKYSFYCLHYFCKLEVEIENQE